MEVTYIYRDKKNKGKSIELVFSTIAKGLKNKGWNTKEFHFSNEKNWFSNAFNLLKNYPCKIYHLTGDVQFLALFLFNKNLVLTIHDIGYYKELKSFKKFFYGLLWIQLPLWCSKVVTTVSDYTKQDLLREFRISSNKVKVIPNPISEIFKFSPYPTFTKKPRILQVGTAENKNLKGVVKALKGIDCELVIIGKLASHQIDILKSNSIEYLNYVDISYEDVYRQYVLSNLVLFVSLHEGFGLPIIEAQVIGRPIICSRVCSLPEVGGDGCFYVDPQNTKEIRNAIQKILYNEPYRIDLIKRGLHNVKRFSLEKVMNQYRNIYESLSTKI